MFTIRLNPEIVHLFGPLSVHVYGIFIALGITSFIMLTWNHPVRKKYIRLELYEKLLIFTTVAALCGARIVHVLSEWQSYHTLSEAVSIWNGGLSILGAVLGGLMCVLLFLWYNKIPILPVLDLGGLYLPLAQAIARLGCLCAGCCFGCQTASSIAVVYTHAASHAPLNVTLIPTQVYSSLIYFVIFLTLQALYRYTNIKAGALAGLYLIFASIERFILDFYRGDRIINSTDALFYSSELSFHQWMSIAVAGAGIVLIFGAFYAPSPRD